MANYYRRRDGYPSPQQNKPCDLEPDGLGGQRLLVDGLCILRLQTHGIIDRPIIAPDLAEHRGLQLDDKGYVRCV